MSRTYTHRSKRDLAPRKNAGGIRRRPILETTTRKGKR